MSDVNPPYPAVNDEDAAVMGRAVELFHDALDAIPWSIHDRDGGWVDGTDLAIVEALLNAGWRPPADD